MRCVRFLCLLSVTFFTAAHSPTASAHDKQHDKPYDKPKDPVICPTPTPPPMPVPVPTPTGGPVVVRDHRTPVIVRDHRKPTGPIIRDHRKPTGPIVRDHRTTTTGTATPSGSPGYSVPPTYTVRPKYSVDASQAPGGVIVTESPRRPIVRDHRKPAKRGSGNSIDLPGPLPNIPLPKLPIGIPIPF